MSLAVGLLAAATLAVLVCLPLQSSLWLGLGSVLALALSWAGLRMMWTEVLHARRENAADRAASAAAYVELFSQRVAEHAEFTAAMTERLAEAHLARRELEGLLTQHQGRAERAESRVATLEKTLATLRAERADDLVAWDQQSTRSSRKSTTSSRKALKGA